MWWAASTPLRRGMTMSSTTTSGRRRVVRSTAAWPSAASPTTSRPRFSSSALSPCRKTAWSSASNTRSDIPAPPLRLVGKCNGVIVPATENHSKRRTLHPLVLRAAAPFPGRPARPQHVGRLTVHAVRRVPPQPPVHQLVPPRRAHVGVERGYLCRDVPPHDEMARDGVARRGPRLEHPVQLTQGELAVRRGRVGWAGPPLHRRARGHRDPAAGKQAPRQRHETGLEPPRVEPVLEGEPHVPRTVQVAH